MTIKKLYTEATNSDTHRQAMEKVVITNQWLFNHSDIDLWFEVDGFTLKVPAGKRSLIAGWDQVRRCVEEMETEEFYGCAAPVSRCGFKFVSGHKLYIYNDLVVFSSDSAHASGGYYGPPERTLEEHIALINAMKLEKATVIADNLSFLPRCPTLKCLHILHAAGQETPLDFTPLYELPEVERLGIAAPNMGLGKRPVIKIDFTKLRGLRHLSVCTNDRFNYHLVPTLETLWLSNDRRHTDMSSLSCSPDLKRIDLLTCGMKSLNGIENYPLQWLSLSYLRSMTDISALADCSKTLRALCIDACGKIKDFSCLHHLTNLEHLHLHGSNTLPNLDFLCNMPKLKTFVFSMTVESGDLTPCLDIPYAACTKMKRHYNLKESDLPKSKDREAFRLN